MSSEQRTFVFSVTFIIVFTALIAAAPVGLMGYEQTPGDLSIDPGSLRFSESETFSRTYFYGTVLTYTYSLGGRDWICYYTANGFSIVAKIYLGVLWLGQVETFRFMSGGNDRGPTLSMTEIEQDANNGLARYSLISESGSSGGTVLFSWNTDDYSTPLEAWTDDGLVITHGIGFNDGAMMDIGTLLLSLLTLQLPGVPVMVNILIAVPIWASIIYLIWYIVKEMIPFV